ncbi:MAG TPA: HlyD family type I secretion periplasmic adaptor subunit [Stellaceae bacterium]|jgi:HlyD family type I secretion membrane fusion protein
MTIQNADVIPPGHSLAGSLSPEVRLPDESLKKYAAAGWITLALFFGVFGVWSVTAPLNGAVVAEAVVKVEGNRKSVQHLDGGIVKQLKVKEGDHVNAGDVMIVLDDTEARANYDVLSQQYNVLRATEARLTAEFNGDPALVPPSDLADSEKGIWEAQRRQFESREAALDGQRQVIAQKIQQLEAQITGDQNEIAAYNHENASVRQEITTISPLVDKGLIASTRRTQLQRTGYGLDGQIAETTADMAKAQQGIAEQKEQIAQIDSQHISDVSKDLQDTQAKLLDVIPRLADAKAVLDRTQIRAPYTGRVVGLAVFGIGSVIGKGEKIMDIVPQNDGLTIEARVAVDDISDVHPGMAADVHLTAYKQRIVPVIHGSVTEVSADRLTDERTGAPYYNATVQVDQQELNKLPSVQLYPGMPASVQIPTVHRTALDYIIGPLTASFSTAFRQK